MIALAGRSEKKIYWKNATGGALPARDNRQLLKRTRKLMMLKYEQRLERKARAVRSGGVAGEGEEESSASEGSGGEGGLTGDEDPEVGVEAPSLCQ